MKKSSPLLLIGFIFSFCSCTLGQSKGTLKLFIRPVASVSDSLNIECIYVNRSDSILLLPIKYFNEVGVQSFIFKDKAIKYDGSDNQYVLDKVEFEENAKTEVREKLLMNYCGLDNEEYYRLKPSDSLKLRFSLKNLQYVGIKKDKQYQVQLRLHINNEFMETCPKMWVGNVESEFTTIKF
jgi:hypothetical protein